MAANQTIIKAAGQRYTSVNPDYSGHLQGLDYITTALINAKKQSEKDAKTLADITDPEIELVNRKPMYSAIRNSKLSIDQKAEWFKEENERGTLLKSNITAIKKAAPYMSAANDPLAQSFVYNATSAFKERTIVVDGYPMSMADNTLGPNVEELDMSEVDYTVEGYEPKRGDYNQFVSSDPDTGHVQVIGIDGEMGSPKNMISASSIITTQDGLEVSKVFAAWGDNNLKDPVELKRALKLVTEGERGKEKLMSFMIDQEEYDGDGNSMNFVDYVLTNMEDASLREQFNAASELTWIDENTEGFGMDGEKIIAAKKEIVRQYIEADFENAKDLFDGFVLEFTNSYKS
tara:strand:+ start:737 stop:1774 length:1038 start_codon:yes stop_codon:yes gene_type:complete